jgi:hypothetical protein
VICSTPHYDNYAAYLRHPVFRAARAVAMRRTNSMCQCGAPATEVHHWNGYPPWGMFDVPSNLRPICHACHCREHGKER